MADNSKSLPPGAHSAAVPGTRANAALKRAPVPKPVVIDPKRFGSDPRGSGELVVGKRRVELKDNRTKTSR